MEGKASVVLGRVRVMSDMSRPHVFFRSAGGAVMGARSGAMLLSPLGFSPLGAEADSGKRSSLLILLMGDSILTGDWRVSLTTPSGDVYCGDVRRRRPGEGEVRRVMLGEQFGESRGEEVRGLVICLD